MLATVLLWYSCAAILLSIELFTCEVSFSLWTAISITQSFCCQVVCCFAIPLL
ncbi:hypothetical protein BDZ91DRAFT_741378 [Kalaharituber pfeilii]|nr:hypothetical protein BDZ91DRAFT_741378 [Kalaharituber pfeilii]